MISMYCMFWKSGLKASWWSCFVFFLLFCFFFFLAFCMFLLFHNHTVGAVTRLFLEPLQIMTVTCTLSNPAFSFHGPSQELTGRFSRWCTLADRIFFTRRKITWKQLEKMRKRKKDNVPNCTGPIAHCRRQVFTAYTYIFEPPWN